MTRAEIIDALNRLKVETRSLACLGCGHENGCSVRGCAILREAVEELEQFNWHPTSTPPPDGRDVFVCRGRPGFLTVCIGFYDHERKIWYENRNWFAKLLPDGLFWCEAPQLPEEVHNDPQ